MFMYFVALEGIKFYPHALLGLYHLNLRFLTPANRLDTAPVKFNRYCDARYDYTETVHLRTPSIPASCPFELDVPKN